MYCFNCGAMIPDGRTTCMACGATQPVRTATKPVGAEFVRNSADEWAQKVRRAEDPLKSIYEFRLFMLVIATVVCAGAVAYLFALINGVEKVSYGYWGDVYVLSDSLKAVTSVYRVITLICGLFAVVILVCLLVAYNEMKRYEIRFSTVFTLALVSIVTSVAEGLSTDSAKIIFSLANIVVDMMMIYHFYGAMADITRPLDRDHAAKWDYLFKVYIVYSVFSIIASIAIVVNASNYNALKFFMALLTVTMVGGIAINVYELRLLKVSVKIFSDLNRRLTSVEEDRWPH